MLYLQNYSFLFNNLGRFCAEREPTIKSAKIGVFYVNTVVLVALPFRRARCITVLIQRNEFFDPLTIKWCD